MNGQAMRLPGWRRGLRIAVRGLVALLMLAGLGAGALAWRLAQGPLDLPWLAPALAQGVALDAETTLRAEGAALRWDGWTGGAAARPSIALGRPSLRGPGVAVTAEAAIASLSVRALFGGRLAATTLELVRPHAVLDLAALPAGDDGSSLAPWLAAPDEMGRHLALRALTIRDGALVLEPGLGLPELRLEEISLSAARGEAGGLAASGAAMLRLPVEDVRVAISGTGATPDAMFAVVLRAGGLTPARLVPFDARLAPLAPLDARLDIGVTLELDRGLGVHALVLELAAEEGAWWFAEGALPFREARARLLAGRDRLELAEARALLADGAAELRAAGRLRRDAAGWRGEAEIDVPRLDLAALPLLWPGGLAPELREAAVASVQRGVLRDGRVLLRGGLGPDGPALREARARLPLEGPRVAGFAAAEALLELSAAPGRLRLEQGVVRLRPARPGAADSVVRLAGSQDGRAAVLDIALDRVAFADLAELWPEALGGGAREWITRHITEGTIHDGAWRIALEAGRLAALEGTARVQGATVEWLAPIPPAVGVNGRARFARDAIVVETEGGRQARPDGTPGGVELAASTLRFTGLDAARQNAELGLQLQGSLPELVEVLRHPRLRLFERRPLEVNPTEGTQSTRLDIGLPLVRDLTADMVTLRAQARLQNTRLARLALGQDLERVAAELTVDTERLRVQGTGTLAGAAVRLGVEMDLRQGPTAQVVSRETASVTATGAQLATLGLDMGDVLDGPVAIELRGERRRNGQAQMTLRADLQGAALSVPAARWAKPAGSPGSAQAVLRFQGERLLAVDNARLDALELSLRGRAAAQQGRVQRIEITESIFGGSRFMGDIRLPDREGAPWQATLRGPFLDLRPIFSHQGGGGQRPGAQAPGTSPPFVVEARFDRVAMGPGREVYGVQARGVLDNRGVLRQAQLRGRTAPQGGAFDLAVAAAGQGRSLRLTAEDGGALIRAFDGHDAVQGGRLTVTGGWEANAPGTALTGTAELEGFALRNAPAIGRVLQAMTLFGLGEALQGGQGLVFSRLSAPFSLTPEVLTVNDWRAFSASLGITARGRVLREADVLDIEGTIVPAYVFNQLLGNLPVLGRLFSPEPGGGVFATAFRAQGPAADPTVTVNPLTTLTPGFLRGLFGLGQEPASVSPRR